MDQRAYQANGKHAGILLELGRGIVNGTYPEGAPLPREAELQESFHASRQSVREAMRVLAAKGMVYARKRAGTFVTARSEWNFFDPDILAWHDAGKLPAYVLRDLVEVRRLIEPSAARLAAERHDTDALEQIHTSLLAMKNSFTNPDHFYEADVRFHMAIFAASGNMLIDRMSTILRPLLEASFEIQESTSTAQGLDEGYEVHEVVYRAIMKRDGRKAQAAMETLLDRALGEVDHDSG